MSIISSSPSTPSRKSSSKLIREGSIISYRPVTGELSTDEYIAKMEEMSDLLTNLEEKMNKVEEKLGEVDELLSSHEQNHKQVITFEKEIANQKQILKNLEQQYCESSTL